MVFLITKRFQYYQTINLNELFFLKSPKKDNSGKKKPAILMIAGFINFWCRRRDSNSHDQLATTPSRWRVYQFHHFGAKRRTLYCFVSLLST